MTEPGTPRPHIVVVDGSRGLHEPGPLATRLVFLAQPDPFDGFGLPYRETAGSPEPLNWRLEDMQRIAESGHEDYRVSLQLIADGDGPLERGLGVQGQSGLWTPQNRSTRVVDGTGRPALLSSAFRVVGAHDGRTTLALALYCEATAEQAGLGSRAQGLSGQDEDDPRGYVYGFGVPINRQGSGRRGAGLERGDPRIGEWSSLVCPEAARGWWRETADGVKVGPLPLNLSGHFFAGQIDPEEGAQWDGPWEVVLRDGSDIKQSGGELFRGWIQPVEVSDSDPEADAAKGFARGNCSWVPVIAVTAKVPPEDDVPPRVIRGPAGPPGRRGPRGPRGPRGGAGVGASCNKQQAPPGLLVGPPGGKQSFYGPMFQQPVCRREEVKQKDYITSPIGKQGTGDTDEIDTDADGLVSGDEAVVGSVPEPGSQARSLDPVDGVRCPNLSAVVMHDGELVSIRNGHAPVTRDDDGNLRVHPDPSRPNAAVTLESDSGQRSDAWGYGDWNVANYPTPIFGEKGAPSNAEDYIKFLSMQVAALQQVVLGLTGGPLHLEANVAAVARDEGHEAAGHHLGSQWAKPKDVSEPTLAVSGGLQAPARATDDTQGIAEVLRVHIGNPKDKRPLIALHDETKSDGDQIRGVDRSFAVSADGGTVSHSLKVHRPYGGGDEGDLLSAGFGPRDTRKGLSETFLQMKAEDGLLRVGTKDNEGAVSGGLSLAEQDSAPTASDALTDEDQALLIPTTSGLYLVNSDGTTTGPFIDSSGAGSTEVQIISGGKLPFLRGPSGTLQARREGSTTPVLGVTGILAGGTGETLDGTGSKNEFMTARGMKLTYTTGDTLNDDAAYKTAYFASIDDDAGTDNEPIVQCHFAVNDWGTFTTDPNFWCGLDNRAGDPPVNDPDATDSAICIGIKCEDGDTNYQWLQGDPAGASPTEYDTGVSVGTEVIMEIVWTDRSTAVGRLYSTALELLDEQSFSSITTLTGLDDFFFEIAMRRKDSDGSTGPSFDLWRAQAQLGAWG